MHETVAAQQIHSNISVRGTRFAGSPQKQGSTSKAEMEIQKCQATN